MRLFFLTHYVIGSIDDQILILTNRQVILIKLSRSLFAVIVQVTFTLLLYRLVRTSDQIHYSTKAMAYPNWEQVLEPWLEPVSSGY